MTFMSTFCTTSAGYVTGLGWGCINCINFHVNLLHKKRDYVTEGFGMGVLTVLTVLAFMSTSCTTSAGYVTEGECVRK